MQPDMQSIFKNLLITILVQKAIACLSADLIKQMKSIFKRCGMDCMYKMRMVI